MSYSKQMQSLFSEYERLGNPMPADLNDVAEWALNTGRWKPSPELARRKLVEDLGRALREDYFTDDRGNRVRAKHPNAVIRNGAQYHLWQDARTASHEHMTGSFTARRNGVVQDLNQLKTDVDWYTRFRSEKPAIPLVLDFTMDIAELEAAKARSRELSARRRKVRGEDSGENTEAA